MEQAPEAPKKLNVLLEYRVILTCDVYNATPPPGEGGNAEMKD
jgi:hypothetical protein